MEIKISVITPTIRLKGLELVEKSLYEQDFKNFEWLICSKEKPSLNFDNKKWRWIKDDFEGGYWTLNRAYNKLFKESKGSLIVTWQDYIYSKPDALTKFWLNYLSTDKKGLISGVGDQYSKLDKYGRPQVKAWNDPRKRLDNGSFYKCMWNDMEWNFASFPRQAIYDIGGMDEELDFRGVGGDQLQVCERWESLGYDFYLDQTNESFTLRHGREDFGGEEKWNSKHVLFNGEYEKRKQEIKDRWHKLEYL